MWHMVGVKIISNVSSQALTVWDRQCLEGSEHKGWLNQWINESKATKVFIEQPLLSTPGRFKITNANPSVYVGKIKKEEKILNFYIL